MRAILDGYYLRWILCSLYNLDPSCRNHTQIVFAHHLGFLVFPSGVPSESALDTGAGVDNLVSQTYHANKFLVIYDLLCFPTTQRSHTNFSVNYSTCHIRIALLSYDHVTTFDRPTKR
jgi:hypothetical protein